jgi:hypothetical protein
MWEPRRLTTLWAFTACYRDSFTLPLPYQELIKRRGVVQCSWFTYAVWLSVPSFVTAWSLRQLTLQKESHLLSASKLLHLALAVHELVLVIVVQCSRTAITPKAMNCCIIKTIHCPITIAILQSYSIHVSNWSTHSVVLLLPLCSAAVVISVYREQLILYSYRIAEFCTLKKNLIVHLWILWLDVRAIQYCQRPI